MSQEQLPTTNGSGQRWSGIAVSCLFGLACGLSIAKALREGAATPGIIYWLVFIIVSGFFIEWKTFFKKLTDVFLFLLPGICVITSFVAPTAVSYLGNRSRVFDSSLALSLVYLSITIFVLTPLFIIIASEAKPTFTGICTKIFARTPKEIQQIGETIEAASKVLVIVFGIIATYIRFVT